MTPAINLTDFYKTDHRRQYPEGTELVYSNFTARISRLKNVEHVVVFGIQAFCEQYLQELFNLSFFYADKAHVIAQYQRRMDTSLGKGAVTTEHLEALWELGYLPIEIKALPEGTICPLKVPMLTIHNTHPKFAWLPNFLETLLSNELWHPITSATIAYEYRKLLEGYAAKTSDMLEFVKWQGHDFSMRGQTCLQASVASGAAHLTCFTGTDTIPAIDFLEEFYGADADKELIGGSVPATEHSVMCLGGQQTEFDTYKRLISEVYPAGIVSIVSDTWDYWHVLDQTVRKLKPEIMARDGKVVIRPDSGDPFNIICGVHVEKCKSIEYARDYAADSVADEASEQCEGSHRRGDSSYTRLVEVEGKVFKITVDVDYNRHDKRYYYVDDVNVVAVEEVTLTPAEKGTMRMLWEIFGGTVNSKGYKQLDPHIGVIYGDSITLDKCKQILEGLHQLGFASTNLVFGIGSYTYQYVTRDTFGFAMKATYGVVNGQPKEIFKDPLTDGGVKKSAKGLLRVNEDLTLSECVTPEEVQTGLLQTVFKDGFIPKRTSLAEIRTRIDQSLVKP